MHLADEERWMPVVGFEGLYEVSDAGRVRSIPRVVHGSDGKLHPRPGRIRKLQRNRDGYIQVDLWSRARPKLESVHRLVATAFLGPPMPGQEVCHGDGDKANNAVVNLRWDTRSANAHDAVRHGSNALANRTHCPRHHRLAIPNLCRGQLRRNHRKCLACARARAFCQFHPDLDMQAVADSYYAAILREQS